MVVVLVLLLAAAAECIRVVAEQAAAPEAEVEFEALGGALLHGVRDPLVHRQGIAAETAVAFHGDTARRRWRAMIAALTML